MCTTTVCGEPGSIYYVTACGHNICVLTVYTGYCMATK